MLNYHVMLILPTIPKIPLTLIGPFTFFFLIFSQNPKTKNLSNFPKSTTLSLSRIFTWNHSHSLAFSKKPSKEARRKDGRRRKKARSKNHSHSLAFSRRNRKNRNRKVIFFCQMKCDSGYFFDISGLFRGSSRCYGIFSGFLHYGLDELDRGSIVGSIEILGLLLMVRLGIDGSM